MDALKTILESPKPEWLNVSTTTWKNIQNNLVNTIADNDMEIYMVWPSTTAPTGWNGWCLDTINGNPVPVACR